MAEVTAPTIDTIMAPATNPVTENKVIINFNDNSKIWLFIRSEFDWADEMDVYGFAIMSKMEWEDIITSTRKYFDKHGEYNKYIGSNQEITIRSFDRWLSNFNVVEIDEDVAKSLIHKFNGYHSKYYWFGKFLVPEDFDDDFDDDYDNNHKEESNKTDETDDNNYESVEKMLWEQFNELKSGTLDKFYLVYRYRLLLQSIQGMGHRYESLETAILDEIKNITNQGRNGHSN